MIKKLTAIGNSLGVIIDRPILDLLQIDQDTPLEVKTDGDVLVLKPIREAHKARVKDAARRLMAAHDKTMRKLAK